MTDGDPFSGFPLSWDWFGIWPRPSASGTILRVDYLAWPAALERELARDFRVEVLNLGVSGSQSEDILRFAERLLPMLEPDLVLYGVCLNDFLPSGRGQYQNNRAWSFALPFGEHLEHGTRLGALAVRAYDQLLMRVGVRADFFTDILRDFRAYQQRFARDVAALNGLVTARALRTWPVRPS